MAVNCRAIELAIGVQVQSGTVRVLISVEEDVRAVIFVVTSALVNGELSLGIGIELTLGHICTVAGPICSVWRISRGRMQPFDLEGCCGVSQDKVFGGRSNFWMTVLLAPPISPLFTASAPCGGCAAAGDTSYWRDV
jgi:hypothetical protein